MSNTSQHQHNQIGSEPSKSGCKTSEPSSRPAERSTTRRFIDMSIILFRINLLAALVIIQFEIHHQTAWGFGCRKGHPGKGNTGENGGWPDDRLPFLYIPNKTNLVINPCMVRIVGVIRRYLSLQCCRRKGTFTSCCEIWMAGVGERNRICYR